MKRDLKRIERTLHQLAESNGKTTSASWNNTISSPDAASQSAQKSRSPSFSLSVQPFPGANTQGLGPALPKLKVARFSNHRHAPNPALATTLLEDIETLVANWQQELRQVFRQIQNLYLEGPIVDGWLESQYRESGVSVETLSHQPNAKVILESPRPGYRLCGLDEQGKVWSHYCPPEQVASVSMAIARYQKLRHLLTRKEYLETRLSQLSETLVVLHGHLSQD